MSPRHTQTPEAVDAEAKLLKEYSATVLKTTGVCGKLIDGGIPHPIEGNQFGLYDGHSKTLQNFQQNPPKEADAPGHITEPDIVHDLRLLPSYPVLHTCDENERHGYLDVAQYDRDNNRFGIEETDKEYWIRLTCIMLLIQDMHRKWNLSHLQINGLPSQHADFFNQRAPKCQVITPTEAPDFKRTDDFERLHDTTTEGEKPDATSLELQSAVSKAAYQISRPMPKEQHDTLLKIDRLSGKVDGQLVQDLKQYASNLVRRPEEYGTTLFFCFNFGYSKTEKLQAVSTLCDELAQSRDGKLDLAQFEKDHKAEYGALTQWFSNPGDVFDKHKQKIVRPGR